MEQTLRVLQTLYSELIEQDITEELQDYYKISLSGIIQHRYAFWKLFSEKLLEIGDKQKLQIIGFFQSSITNLFGLYEESSEMLKEKEKALEGMKETIRKKEEMIEEFTKENKNLSNKIKDSISQKDIELIEKLRDENQDLVFQNNELIIAVEQLQAENKSYLEKIIAASKLTASTSVTNLRSPTDRKDIVPRPPSNKLIAKNRIANSRELTLKQLKESIQEIYTSKVKFDEKCYESKQPRETMDQFLYTYLNQKYGLKSLIGEWSVLILKGIEKFESQDAEISLFSKILNNHIDEEFRLAFDKLKDNMKQILKAKIQQRNPYMREVQLNSTLKDKMGGILDEDEWATIIVSMFSQDEAQFMIKSIKKMLDEKTTKLIIGKRNKITTGKSDATYAELQNFILNYDLSAREALLDPFFKKFAIQDTDSNGIINEEQFRNLCVGLGLGEEADRLLDQVDPNTTGVANFSDCVTLFTYEMISNEDSMQISVLHQLFFQNQR